jgi:hypothetical protein
MMVVGMPGTNAKTDRLHMTLWAMGGGPLLIGADLTKLDQTMLATLRNLDVLAIDQDPLGLQAVKVGEVSPGLEIWSKRLGTTGRRAVMFLNRTHYPAPFAVEGQAVGLRGPISSARDVWAGSTVALSSGALRVDVPAQDALLLMVQGEDAAPDHYTASTSRSQVTVEGVKARPGPTAMLRLTYRNSGPDSVRAIYVNGETGTHVAFPKTTGLKTVSLQIKMDRAAGGNRIAIEGGGQDTVRVVAVDVY